LAVEVVVSIRFRAAAAARNFSLALSHSLSFASILTLEAPAMTSDPYNCCFEERAPERGEEEREAQPTTMKAWPPTTASMPDDECGEHSSSSRRLERCCCCCCCCFCWSWPLRASKVSTAALTLENRKERPKEAGGKRKRERLRFSPPLFFFGKMTLGKKKKNNSFKTSSEKPYSLSLSLSLSLSPSFSSRSSCGRPGSTRCWPR